MRSLTVRNVNSALPLGLVMLRDEGKVIAPRGLATLELEGPVATTYQRPHEMVLFDPMRDANPMFHFFEALWILAGRQDVKFLAHFNARMADYSDDGKTFHAPYGYRMRNAPDVLQGRRDQIESCIAKLKADPDSRQCVISIWDVGQDWQKTVDCPCNSTLVFKIRDGALRMTVCNRSNDVIWGAYGANVVQFSTLLVYMARRIGIRVGQYTQISDSYHVYESNPYWQAWVAKHPAGVQWVTDPYASDDELDTPSEWMRPEDIFYGGFDTDLKMFFYDYDNGHAGNNAFHWETGSFADVVMPMWKTHAAWKSKEPLKAMSLCATIQAPDWRKACREWMQRRIDK